MRNNELKLENKLSILRCLYKRDCSRAELVKTLGLCKASISYLINQLQEEGFICEIGQGQSSELGGKKPIIISINPFATLILSIHFDGKICGIAFTDMKGKILGSRFFPITLWNDYRKTFDFILEQLTQLNRELAEYMEKYRTVVCGISTKGIIDSVYGVIKYNSANPDWVNIPIGSYFANKTNTPVYVDNDARAISCLESVYGGHSSNDMIVCVFIEDGIGTSVLMGNHIIRGTFFGAVNFAHTTMDRDGPLCHCGKRGCWEALASLEALVTKIASASPDFKDCTFEDICNYYTQGDKIVTDIILNDFCIWIGVGIANILSVFNPSKLILYAHEALLNDRAQKSILRTVLEYSNNVTSQTRITFNTDIPAVHLKAAAAMVINRFLSTETHEFFLKNKDWRKSCSL
jgi:predicted NBD/HSP70 family sugar kinase